ncbi:MAG TPA: zinc ribbon domain-containing protein [Anaerolineales bacterium]|nr:zinc ribbon domain-containing protein [Anaerolineales bacterium]
MGAQGVVQMADKMTGALFARMTPAEKIGLMRAMMTVCLTNILKNLAAEEKQRMVGHGWHGLLLDTPTFRACDDAVDDVRFRQHDDQWGGPTGGIFGNWPRNFTCPSCGSPLQQDWKVCPHCGASLKQ